MMEGTELHCNCAVTLQSSVHVWSPGLLLQWMSRGARFLKVYVDEQVSCKLRSLVFLVDDA